jgi:hypothetical protein
MIKVLTNKHVIIAMIVAPILAVITYYAVDYSVSEKPQQAIEGQSYPLAAKSNCRYESGKCTFKNGDVDITLVAEKVGTTQLALTLTSTLPIQGAKIALANDASSPAPEAMIAIDQSQEQWTVTLPNIITETSRLHIALAVNDSIYFGETETIFTTYKTGFPQKDMHKNVH